MQYMQTSEKEKQVFVIMIQRFLTNNVHKDIRILKSCKGFTFQIKKDSEEQIEDLLQSFFDLTLKQFEKKLKNCGFQIKRVKSKNDINNPQIRVYKHRQYSFEKNQQVQLMSQSSQEEIKLQDEKDSCQNKSGFKIFEGDLVKLVTPQNEKNSDAFLLSKAEVDKHHMQEVISSHELFTKNKNTACKMIREAMISLMCVHRLNNKGKEGNLIMDKIAHIYDRMSQNVELVSEIVDQEGQKKNI